MGITAVYNRHRYTDEKRAALDAWSRELERLTRLRRGDRGQVANGALIFRGRASGPWWPQYQPAAPGPDTCDDFAGSLPAPRREVAHALAARRGGGPPAPWPQMIGLRLGTAGFGPSFRASVLPTVACSSSWSGVTFWFSRSRPGASGCAGRARPSSADSGGSRPSRVGDGAAAGAASVRYAGTRGVHHCGRQGRAHEEKSMVAKTAAKLVTGQADSKRQCRLLRQTCSSSWRRSACARPSTS